jgi:hypothetical protein
MDLLINEKASGSFKAQRLGSEMEKSSKRELILTFLGAISQAPPLHHQRPEAKRLRKSSCSEKGSFCSITGMANSRSVDMDGILLDAMAASDQFYDTTDIPADVVDPGGGKSVLDVPSNELFLP